MGTVYTSFSSSTQAITTLRFLDRCYKLFPDIEPDPQTRCYFSESIPEMESPPKNLTKAMIKYWASILAWKLELNTSSQSFKIHYHLTASYGGINKPELWKVFLQLRKDAVAKSKLGTSLTPATSATRTFIQTVMNFHILVARAPIVFQIVDFRSTNTERPEAKLAWIKNVLNTMTDKNLKLSQALREVLLLIRNFFYV